MRVSGSAGWILFGAIITAVMSAEVYLRATGAVSAALEAAEVARTTGPDYGYGPTFSIPPFSYRNVGSADGRSYAQVGLFQRHGYLIMPICVRLMRTDSGKWVPRGHPDHVVPEPRYPWGSERRCGRGI